MKQRLNEYWQTRSPRDRTIITVIGVLVLLSIVYAYLWLPMNEARTRLRAELPALRGAAAGMRLQAEEIGRLKARAVDASATASEEVVNQSAAAAGLEDELTQVTRLSPQRLQITLDAVAFDRWVAWTKALASGSGLRVESAQITASGDPGTVKVQAVLALPGR